MAAQEAETLSYAKGEPVPRRASTIVLVRDDPFEVLMVARNSKGAFPSALVFPGGAVDTDDADAGWLDLVTGAESLDTDERANRIAAARELWEETGVSLARGDARPSGRVGFRELLAANELRLALDEIVPFGHWITPIGEPRRFDTRFYLARAPREHEVVPDGAETLSAQWLAPSEGTELAKKANVLFPTLMNLARLAESRTVDEALAAASARPVVTVAPVLSRDPDGTVVITIPESAGYGVTQFRVNPTA
jgi:8-oxo-dGTP pyrophosphatase MutT (NUDIX family)